MTLRLLTFYALLLLAATHSTSGQTLQIDQPFIDTIKCRGDSLYLPYSTSGSFNTGNTFTVQISNASGSFTSPVTIGTTSATSAGLISCKLPQNTPAGIGYRVRIISSSPALTSTDNGKDIVVKHVPAKPLAWYNGPLCAGDTLFLHAVSSLTETYQYNWSGPISDSCNWCDGIGIAIPNVTTAYAGVYSVTATSSEGCTSEDTTLTIVINSLPDTPAVSSNSPVCGGANIDLTVSSTPGSTFSWTGPNGFSDTGATPTIHPATIANAGTYQVIASLNGCSSITATTATTVVVNDVSSARAFVSPNDTICPGGTATFVAIPQNAGASPSFQWYRNGNIIPGETNPILTKNGLLNNDSVYCRMTATNVCTSPLTIYTNVVKMNVLPGITVAPAVTITSTPTQPGPGRPVTFYATAATGGGISPTFQWQRNGVDVPGAVHATFSVNNLGPHEQVRCILISDDACASPKNDTSNVIVVNFPTGIVDVNNEGFTLYPNPNKGSFTLKGNFDQRQVAVDVFNALGQVIYSDVMEPVRSELKVNLGVVSTGAYLLRISADGQTLSKRFTVE